MEERIQRPATSFSQPAAARESARDGSRRFVAPSVVEISLCCEISAYAPDGDDVPLF